VIMPVEQGTQILNSGNTSQQAALEIYKTDLIERIVEKDGRVLWIEPQSGGIISATSGPSIALGRMMKGFGAKSSIHVMFIEIPIQSILNSFESVRLGSNSNLFIVDSENRNVVSSDKEMIGEP